MQLILGKLELYRLLHKESYFNSCSVFLLFYSNAGYGLVNGDCLACPAGSYSPAGSSVDCVYCDVGQYSPPLAAYCFACPLDTYAQNTGTANCTKCSPGFIATMGATSCSVCPPGTYVADTDRCANCLGVGVSSCGPATYAANTW